MSAVHPVPVSGDDKGILAQIMAGLAAERGEKKTVMIDATYPKPHRTATGRAAQERGAVV